MTESGFSFTDSKWQAAGTARAPSRTLGSVAQVGRVPCPKGQGRPPSPPNPFIRASDRQASSPGRTTNSWRRPDPLLSLRAAKSTAPSWRPSKQPGEHLRHKLRHRRTPKARSAAPHLRPVLEKPRTNCWQVLYAREKLQAFSPLLALSVLPRAAFPFPSALGHSGVFREPLGPSLPGGLCSGLPPQPVLTSATPPTV